MATLFDGAPIFAPIPGQTALSADQVLFQAACITAFEARNGIFWHGTAIQLAAGSPAAAYANCTLRKGTGALVADTGFMFWLYSGNDMEMLFPLTGLMVGQVITEVSVTVGGSNASTGGAIDLYYGSPVAAVNTQDITSATANVFDPNGGGLDDEAFPIVYTENAGVFPLAVVAGAQYYIVIVAGGASGNTNRIYDIGVETQFGA
ncbi:MAG: hypothetical protein V3W44_10750 [Dehalococcoidales bacterium]